MNSDEIRLKFLKYFESRGHAVLPGSSLIPKDPTVLLTLAGMLQFKPVFMGLEKPLHSRAATVQKCVRTNDIENVGHTARHHTFFEMLGNFSFGDYFKKEAIAFAWELITKDFNIDHKRLHIAVFEDDEESVKLWEAIAGEAGRRVVKLGEDNNFWAAGPTGPCGPCSEIYYDLGEKFGCGQTSCAPGCECDRFLEIWNLVFMEFNRDEAGKLTPLPKKNIDTGMGLERIASVLQGVDSNFETDLFIPIIDAIKKYGVDPGQVSLRIISDHIRAAAHLIADGLVPGNEGRNYVLRRIIRRAVMHGRKIGIREAFLGRLSDIVVELGKVFYKELQDKKNHIAKIISLEEEGFGRTIEQGSEVLNEILSRSSSGVVEGKDIFRLYDTFGFPYELTKEIALERGFGLDATGFDIEMEKQKTRSREKSSKTKALEAVPQVKGYPATEFVGYEMLETEAVVLGAVGAYGNTPVPDGPVFIILDRSPFYVESGGQDSDKGWIEVEKNRIEIKRLVKTADGVILHQIEGGLFPQKGEKVRAEVDRDVRRLIAGHHTSTHLLHAALRKVLGEHVKQSGSFVTSDRFRFDFNSAEALKAEELRQIEEMINGWIDGKMHVETISTTLDEAKKMGAMALFDSKYATVGAYSDTPVLRLIKIDDISMELCGGTHVRNTSEIGMFKIMKEGAIAQGVRRIEAVAGKAAQEYMRQKEEAGEKERAKAEAKVKAKEEEEEQKKEALSMVEGLIKNAEQAGNINFVYKEFKAFPMPVLKEPADRIIKKLKNSLVVFISRFDDKVLILTAVSSDLQSKGFHAGNIVKELASVVGGRGGGRADMAEAGGKDVHNTGKIHDEIKRILVNLV